jgi:hypothetical protein
VFILFVLDVLFVVLPAPLQDLNASLVALHGYKDQDLLISVQMEGKVVWELGWLKWVEIILILVRYQIPTGIVVLESATQAGISAAQVVVLKQMVLLVMLPVQRILAMQMSQ